jgi:hypothetical protein
VAVVRNLSSEVLCNLSPEEDFIPGIMPGYGTLNQCERYLKKTGNTEQTEQSA